METMGAGALLFDGRPLVYIIIIAMLPYVILAYLLEAPFRLYMMAEEENRKQKGRNDVPTAKAYPILKEWIGAIGHDTPIYMPPAAAFLSGFPSDVMKKNGGKAVRGFFAITDKSFLFHIPGDGLYAFSQSEVPEVWLSDNQTSFTIKEGKVISHVSVDYPYPHLIAEALSKMRQGGTKVLGELKAVAQKKRSQWFTTRMLAKLAGGK